jgi:tRNA threonylcarbamoyl adenosine modification protein YeaZ
MDLTLAIIACGPQLEVALGGGEMAVPSVVRLAGGSPRSTLLMAAVDLVAEDASIAPGRIAAVAVSRGPGSFTGIRSGLATAAGLAAATGCRTVAYDSLLVQACRVDDAARVWAAQPGRRGELYVRPYTVGPDRVPEPLDGIHVVAVDAAEVDGGWVAAERLDLGRRLRLATRRSAAEALLELVARGATGQAPEPVYVEGPPVQRADSTRGR